MIRNIKYRIRKDDPTGFEDAIRLVEQYPEDPHAWDTVAYAHEARKDYPAAIAAISRAIELNPKDPALFFDRGEYALQTGDHERAVADFGQGLILCDEPRWEYLREVLHFLRAEAFVHLGKKAEALADLSHVRDDYRFWTTELRSKADLLVMCGESVPPPKEQEQEEEPPVTSPVMSETPDEEEAALAKELGEAGLAAVDAALLKQVIYRYQKAARVIVDALDFGRYPLDDTHVRLFARRLIALAESGAIVARGNLLNPRRSEVGLPEKP
ncbi:tetratricopeptide repeat protein [Polyangium jinanense]|uniref:Tetratricopeptide repeat protein n=1 Tax=Polyangium jinanense TaxID=2829994 RepID=A0A9X3XH24_9BACT|nr:tetratricopeptide repeat protein [Polyangium jinanense]MDC3961835.1 tetratricopeptide repeat protein [Polyangium jinanense]MDC3988563.1 tetratricopeptide repeat protein [Polyangium jinanense]